MRALVLCGRLDERRRRLLDTLIRDAAETHVARPGDPIPDPRQFQAVLLDGSPSSWGPGLPAALAASVEAGTSLVVIGWAPASGDGAWSDLLGAAGGEALPSGEVFARVAAGASALGTRLPREFAVVDRFLPLEPGSASDVVLEVRVGLRDRAAVVETLRGRGRVLVAGLGASDRALAAPDFAQLIRRALRPRSASRASEVGGRNLGVGVVGYGPLGGMGYHHGLGAGATPGLELVAVVDPDLDRRKAAQSDFPGIRAYASVDDLTKDDDVELAFVATPPVHHARLTLALLRAGKHVACEKPLCLTLAEADGLLAAAAASRRVLTVHQNRRWDPDFVAVRRAVDCGLLGELFSVETFVGGFAHPCQTWHSEVSVSGGAVYDWGAHHVDWILQLLAGPPRRVQAQGHKRVWHDVTNLDQVRVRFRWADGREAEFVHSDIAAVRRPKFYIQGTAGTLVGHYRPLVFERIEPGRGYVGEPAHHAEAPVELTLARYESGYGVTETRLPPAPDQPFAFHRNLADHLHLDEPLAVTPQSIREVVAVLEAAERSCAQGGAPVTLDLRGG
jgi:predicted dehydrogenase